MLILTFFPARMSLRIPSALMRSFLFTRMMPSSSGTTGVAGLEEVVGPDFVVEGSAGDDTSF